MMKHYMIVLCLAITILGCGSPTRDPSQQKTPTGTDRKISVGEDGLSPEKVESVKRKLVERIRESGLSRIAKDLEKLMQVSIRITTERTGDRQLEVGTSKIGGMPDLPQATKWPRWKGTPLAFIAQLRMDDLAKYDLSGQLPRSGVLCFFYDGRQETWGFDPKDCGSWKVFHFCWQQVGVLTQRARDKLDTPQWISLRELLPQVSEVILGASPDAQSDLSGTYVKFTTGLHPTSAAYAVVWLKVSAPKRLIFGLALPEDFEAEGLAGWAKRAYEEALSSEGLQ